MVYDIQSNITQLAERRDASSPLAMQAISMKLRQFANEFQQQQQVSGLSECSIFPAVRDMLMNLSTPEDIPPPKDKVRFLILFRF